MQEQKTQFFDPNVFKRFKFFEYDIGGRKKTSSYGEMHDRKKWFVIVNGVLAYQDQQHLNAKNRINQFLLEWSSENKKSEWDNHQEIKWVVLQKTEIERRKKSSIWFLGFLGDFELIKIQFIEKILFIIWIRTSSQTNKVHYGAWYNNERNLVCSYWNTWL